MTSYLVKKGSNGARKSHFFGWSYTLTCSLFCAILPVAIILQYTKSSKNRKNNLLETTTRSKKFQDSSFISFSFNLFFLKITHSLNLFCYIKLASQNMSWGCCSCNSRHLTCKYLYGCRGISN